MTKNNVAAQAGDFDPAPKYEYSPDGKTVKWTNRDRMPKVAAQAGDEPMPCTCPSGDGSLRWPCPQHPPELDVVVEANRALLHARSQLGIKKYGGTLDAMRHPRRALLQHALEEALDLSNYLQADIQAIDREAATVKAVPSEALSEPLAKEGDSVAGRVFTQRLNRHSATIYNALKAAGQPVGKLIPAAPLAGKTGGGE